MDNINQNIKDTFDMLSLIIIFVFVLFDIQYPKIVKDINEKIPVRERVLERNNHKKKLISSFFKNCLPMIIINSSILYLLLPLTIKVLQNSTLDFWNFDLVKTSLILIFIFISLFFIWSIVLGINLMQRVNESR